MSCQQVRPESIQAYLDKEFPANEHSEIEKHIVDCVSCKTTIGQLQGISNLLSDVPTVETSPDYLSRIESCIEGYRLLKIRYTRFAAAVAAVILIGIGAFFILSSGALFDNSLKFVNSDSEDKYISISEQVKILLAPHSEVAFTGGSNTSYGTLRLGKGRVTIAISSPLNVPISVQTGVDSFDVSKGAVEVYLLEIVPNGHKTDKGRTGGKGLLVNYY